MTNLDTLKTFLRVAELRSFSAAAAESQLARGVASRRIAQLEAALGQPLFSRTTRRVDLTPAGELLADTLQRALHDIELGVEAVRELRTAPSGVLRLTAPVSWGNRVLGALLPRFLDKHPHIEVELVLSDSVLDLAAERLDLGFRMSDALDPNLVAIKLAPMKRQIYASGAYLRRNGTPRRPEDLDGRALMTYWRPTLRDPLQLRRGDRSIAVAARGRYRANSPEAVLAAVRAGSCMGVLPDYLGADLREGETQLRTVLPEWTVSSIFGEHVVAVGLRERMQLARSQALLAFMRKAL